MRLVYFNVLVILFVMVFLLFGCATREVIVTQDVYIPIKCDVSVPERPIQKEYVNDVINIIEYVEKLEAVVDVCVKKEEK